MLFIYLFIKKLNMERYALKTQDGETINSIKACNLDDACGLFAKIKKMPVDKWIEICKQIDFPIMLLGGKEDAENAASMCQHDPVKIYNACGKFSLLESAHLIKKARVVVTHDTGLMHIAAAFKKPIISIWGNTVPAFGMFPYYGSNNVHTHIAPQLTIIEKKISCRPCSKIGYKSCPKKHFNCMNQLSNDNLVKQIQRVIQENK